jgi:ATP-dependent helicase/nuclease subunit A
MTFPLNEGQERAAGTLEGPVLISAGAGTGKTRALTERFVRAVLPGAVGGWTPAAVDELLTITFTDKAAGELAERIRSSLRAAGMPREARQLDGAWISTIHGFCARILRRHALEAGLDPGFTVADETEAREIREQAFEKAARTAHSSSAVVRELFALYGFQQVWNAVALIARMLETHGLGPDDIAAEPVPDAEGLHAEAVGFFRAAQSGLAPHVCAIKGAANHAGACRSLLEALEPLDVQSMGQSETAAHLWRALEEYSARGGSAAPIRDTCEELKAFRARLIAEAVAVITAPSAEALRALTAEYVSTLGVLKEERGVLDFGDLQLHAARLLETRPELRDRYRAGFRLVMVDEFQDTDELQMRIVRAVTGDNLCTVGDERQSIYRFRGADLDVYRHHREEMADAGARPVELVENYRSHPDIIDFVNRVFSAPPLFGEAVLRLTARRNEPDPPLVPHGAPRIMADLVHSEGRGKVAPRHVEAEALARRFVELRNAGVSPGEMVVLVRRYSSADTVAAALRQQGFPVLVVGGRRFLDRPEIRMLRALCSVIANPRDDVALATLLLSPMSGVSDDGVWLLRNAEESRMAGPHLWEGLGIAARTLPPADAIAAVALHGVIERARDRAGALSLAEVLKRAVEESEADLALLGNGDEGLQAFANVLRFVRKADDFERAGGAGAAAFAARLEAEERFGYQESPSAVTDDGSPAVRIMSVHASKGLEFPVVALPLLDDTPPADSGTLRARVLDGRLEVALALPSGWGGSSLSRRTLRFEEMRSREADAQAEEAKRLFYVACTRAREVLLLSGSANLDKDPAEAAECSLGLARRALGPVLDGVPGTDERRPLPGGTSLAVRVHEVAEEDVFREPGPTLPQSAAETPPASAVHARIDASTPVGAGVGPTRPDRLSYSDISAFEECSLRYWAHRVARLGSVEALTEGDPMRFGSALHAVLQLGGSEATAQLPDRIEAIARFYRLGPDGTARLREAVERFRTAKVAADLESHDVVRREHPFSVRMAGARGVVELVGAMDAYARTGPEGLIVDYKSGTSEAGIDELRARFVTQARCYAYAALGDGCERVRIVFVRPEVEHHGDVQQVAFEFVSGDASAIEKVLLERYEAISSTPYRPLSEWNDAVCRGCRIAGTLCPLTPPGRAAG